MRERLIPAGALMIAIAIFFGYVMPEWNGAVAEARAAIAADNQALAAANQYTTEQNQLATERDAIDPASLSRLTAMLPDSVDNVNLILDLNALAARTGFLLSKVDVAQDSSTAAVKGPTGSVDLTLSGVGSYTALHSFLDGMERSLRLLDVRDLAVKGSDTGVYTYQMRVRLYWLR